MHFKGRDQWVSVPATPVQVSSCSTDVTAPLCSVLNAVIAAVWKFGLTVLI